MRREFTAIIERGEDGYYFAQVPELRACHTQAKTLDELMERLREVIELCLEVEGGTESPSQFVGIQRIAVGSRCP